MLESCNESCGWIAALISCVAFGSFGVPIKSNAANSVDVDPLVFQSYKTAACFASCWIVLLLGEELMFSPWGIVSGIFWVPAGVAAIYGIRNAGLAVAQGTWSSLIVMVSFFWGIVIFNECMESVTGAMFGIAMMVCGLWGMSYFSSPEIEYETLNEQDVMGDDLNEAKEDETIDVRPLATVYFCGRFVSRRTMGLASAVFNGVWGGSVLVPMHFAGSNASGLGFVISFAIGASIVTLFLWIIRIVIHLPSNSYSLQSAIYSLPSFHIRVLWCVGVTSGLLWSLGNICSMISVTYLGEGVGYSVVQASMLVSGLWGIFWFREVTGSGKRMKWFSMAVLTIAGILLLGYEHHGSTKTADSPDEPKKNI